MEVERLPEAATGRERYDDVFRFYKLAKRAEWGIDALPWEDRPLIPELRGSPEKRRRGGSTCGAP